MPLRVLFIMVFGLLLMLPAQAQSPQMFGQGYFDEERVLHDEIKEAIKNKDNPKVDQLKKQLITVHNQQAAYRKQLSIALDEARKSGDKSKIQQLDKQFREQARPTRTPSNRALRRSQWMLDPQVTALYTELRDAVNSKDTPKADQLRKQIRLLHKQQLDQQQD